MGLEKVKDLYQGVLTCNITNLDEVTSYLNEIKKDSEIDKKENAVYFNLENEGRVITQPTDGKIWLMCNNLSEEVAKKLERLVEK